MVRAGTSTRISEVKPWAGHLGSVEVQQLGSWKERR